MQKTEFTAFNLLRAPWLPAKRRSGGIRLISPSEITAGIAQDPFESLAWPRPDFNGAAHEFLIGLLSTAASPSGQAEWATWWERPPAPEDLETRFATVAHAFDLDGPGPRFMQDFDPLDGAARRPVTRLLIDTPGTRTLHNNADLFVKRRDGMRLSRAAAAMALFTLNCYAPVGGAGHRTSLRGGGPMTTLVSPEHPQLGNTLWGRLWANVESSDLMERRTAGVLDTDAIFPWLAPTRVSSRKTGGGPTTPDDVHPLQVYWGMPRRIRLEFEASHGAHCDLTGTADSTTVAHCRTRNHGVEYSGGFEHPLTPYYRQTPSAAKRPVHPKAGSIGYRRWPGLAFGTEDPPREPAQVVRHWPARAGRSIRTASIVVFGYDMDNMKARGWVEGEIPFWRLPGAAAQERCAHFAERVTAAASTAAGLLTSAVKSARYDRPEDRARGDYGFIAERFFRETETAFDTRLEGAVTAVRENPGSDDPTRAERTRWAPVLATAALRLFDEYVPDCGLEHRDMHRHVKARFLLSLALNGRGKQGKALFESDLEIPAPEMAGEPRHGGFPPSKKPPGGGVTDARTESGPAVAFDWWRELTGEDSGRRREALARMRRAATPLAVMREPQALRLIERLSRNPVRVAVLAGVLAFVRENDARHVARAIGRRSLDEDAHPRPVMSEARFRHFLRTPDDGLMEAMRRLVRLTGGRANVRCLAQAILDWADPVRREWIFTYYNGGTDTLDANAVRARQSATAPGEHRASR